MTEKRWYILDVVGGCLVTWGSVFLLDAVGAAEKYKITAGLLGIVVFSLLVGVIGNHYHDKAVAEGKDPADRFR